VKPPLGPSRRLWFSEKTGLLTRMATRVDHSDAEMYYSAYRTLAGRKRPTLQDAVNQDIAYLYDETPVNRVRLDSLWADAVDSAVFSAPESNEGTVAWLKSQGAARVGFRYSGRHVWIKASFNGAAPADFILDTGASTTSIDRDYARRIGLIKEGAFGVQGMGGDDEASIAHVRSVRITGGDGDGVRVSDLKVSILDFGEGREGLLWRNMNGLIGYDVLSRFVVEIDYDRKTVTFREPKTFVYAGTGAPPRRRGQLVRPPGPWVPGETLRRVRPRVESQAGQDLRGRRRQRLCQLALPARYAPARSVRAPGAHRGALAQHPRHGRQ
jgi:hypothetical protein